MVIEDKKYGIDEVFAMIGEEHLSAEAVGRKCDHNIVVDGFDVHSKSLRYMTFYQKGVKCVCCGKEGTHFKLCGEEGTNRRHFNLYADDGTLITKDHIIPASKGGRDHVSNMQPMCTLCNGAKGNSNPDVQVEYIVGRHETRGTEIAFRSMDKAVYTILCNSKSFKSKHIKKEEAVKAAITATVKMQIAIDNNTSYRGYIWSKEMR